MPSGEPMSVRCQMHRLLREVHQRYPVEHLAEALAEGLMTGHPGKPAFRFDAKEVDDIIEYLKSLEQ